MIAQKDKIVNSSILLADISYEQIMRALELRNSKEKLEKTLRNSSENTTKESSETYMPAKQVIRDLQEDLGTRTSNYENKTTGESDTHNTCITNTHEQTVEEWLDAYGQ